MKIFNGLKSWVNERKNIKGSVGFVPTMGALHAGHLALITQSRQENDLTVCSIFVNPTQFNNAEDLQNYPRTEAADADKLRTAGCDVLLIPPAAEVYASIPRISFAFDGLDKAMEGQHRPGHFNGVALIVSKLLHWVNPDRAYFGQKDWQQFVIVRQLVRDLSFPVSVIACPTVREPDGLALSSRNQRLSAAQRQQAPQIYRVLQAAATHLHAGISPAQVTQTAMETLAATAGFDPEYFVVADAETLQPINKMPDTGRIILATAVYLRPVRLIDNLLIDVSSAKTP
ncbi:MAG: pantoate--beta-alanine ligase [Bernardetiaceae bacterium]